METKRVIALGFFDGVALVLRPKATDFNNAAQRRLAVARGERLT